MHNILYVLDLFFKREMWYSVQSHLVQLVAFYISQQNEGKVRDEVKSTRDVHLPSQYLFLRQMVMLPYIKKQVNYSHNQLASY